MTEEPIPPQGSVDDTHKALDKKLTEIHKTQRFTLGILVAFFLYVLFKLS